MRLLALPAKVERAIARTHAVIKGNTRNLGSLHDTANPLDVLSSYNHTLSTYHCLVLTLAENFARISCSQETKRR